MLDSSRPHGAGDLSPGLQRQQNAPNHRRSFTNVNRQSKRDGPKERALLYINLSRCTLDGKHIDPYLEVFYI